MKVHNNLEELLEDFGNTMNKYLFLEVKEKYIKRLVRSYISSNSLALGKPEPLAKNKQTESICKECQDKGFVEYTETKAYLCSCQKLKNAKDATSR